MYSLIEGGIVPAAGGNCLLRLIQSLLPSRVSLTWTKHLQDTYFPSTLDRHKTLKHSSFPGLGSLSLHKGERISHCPHVLDDITPLKRQWTGENPRHLKYSPSGSVRSQTDYMQSYTLNIQLVKLGFTKQHKTSTHLRLVIYDVHCSTFVEAIR